MFCTQPPTAWKLLRHPPLGNRVADILKSQIAPENTKNAAYTRKPYSMAAQIERPNRAARSDGPNRTRPPQRGQIERTQPNAPDRAAKSNAPIKRPQPSGQIERPQTERPQSSSPNRAAKSKSPTCVPEPEEEADLSFWWQ